MAKPRKPAPAPKPPAGVRWRDGRAYYERVHTRLVGGRLIRSLGTRDPDLAHQYAGALNTLADRGDWPVIERWRDGEIHISDIARAVRDGDYGTMRRMEGTRLGVAVKAFMRGIEGAHKTKPQTIRIYGTGLDLLLAAWGEDFVMATATRESCVAFLHAPKDTTHGGEVWAPRTQKLYRTLYVALWKQVIEDEYERARMNHLSPATTENPWSRVKVPEQRTTRHAFLTAEQWQRLITHPAVVDTPMAAFLACGCLAGLRQQEIANLRTGTDVDLAAGVLRVQDRAGGHAWTAKRASTQRDVPIVPALRALLERHAEQGFAGARFFFHAARRDRPLPARTATSWTEAAFKAAGLRYGRRGDALTLHSLRHTFASWLTLDGVPFTVTADLMGDKPETVMHYYAHLTSSDRHAAMQRIQERVQ